MAKAVDQEELETKILLEAYCKSTLKWPIDNRLLRLAIYKTSNVRIKVSSFEGSIQKQRDS